MDRRTRSLPVASTFTFGEDRLYESVTVYEPERKFVKTGLLDQYATQSSATPPAKE
jgi:hypothetical protein